jgi:hypothetical protein
MHCRRAAVQLLLPPSVPVNAMSTETFSLRPKATDIANFVAVAVSLSSIRE